MPNFHQVLSFESEAEIQRAQALILDVIEDPGNFKAEWTSQHDWVVVPVESADHFGETDVKRLAAAFRKAGHDEVLAVATEPLENTPVCYKVPTTEAGLREINRATRNFCFVLIPKDRSCAVLCTKDDYYLVGGPLPFVVLALSISITEARADFVAFAENSPHPAMKKGLLDIAERYGRTGPLGISGASSLQPLIPPS